MESGDIQLARISLAHHRESDGFNLDAIGVATLSLRTYEQFGGLAAAKSEIGKRGV